MTKRAPVLFLELNLHLSNECHSWYLTNKELLVQFTYSIQCAICFP